MGKVKMRNTIANGGMTGHDTGIGRVFAYRGNGYSQVKRFKAPSNPRSAAQLAVRGMFATTSSGWSGLSEVERNAWNTAAPDWVNTGVFGAKKQSGKNLYTGCNIALLNAGLPAISVPGSKTPFVAIETVDFDLNTTHLRAVVTNGGDVSSENAIVIVTEKLKSAGTNSVGKLTTIKAVNCGAGVDFSIDFKTEFEAKYGALLANKKIFASAYLVTQGGNRIQVPVANGTGIILA